MKIVLAEKVSPATLAIFKQEPGWNVVTADQIAPGGLPAELADADALIVRSAVQADAPLLASAPKLRIIGRAGVGVDNIDAAEATRRGIGFRSGLHPDAAARASPHPPRRPVRYSGGDRTSCRWMALDDRKISGRAEQPRSIGSVS